MAYYEFLWTDANKDHIAQHGISERDFESVVCHPQDQATSRVSGLPAAFGHIADGRYIIAIYEMIDEVTVHPVTAYEVPEPRA